MPLAREVVVTGMGVVSPIGLDVDSFWTSLSEGRSGIGPIARFDTAALPIHFGAEVRDFKPAQYVRPRKSLKVMSRDIQFAVATADLARQHAGLGADDVDPERIGVTFGCDWIHVELEPLEAAYRACTPNGAFDKSMWGQKALPEILPLWMLKYLPNMGACHVAITQDARGPCNSNVLGEVSSLLAIAESARVIERGAADVMITGGTGIRIHPTDFIRSAMFEASRRESEFHRACRPFDAHREGLVNGEGAAAYILEAREHAEARGARIYARVLGSGSSFANPRGDDGARVEGQLRAIRAALADAQLEAPQIGHVNADGRSTVAEDRLEAQAIQQLLGDIPVTAPKSFFGYLGAGSGAVEMLASVLGFEHNQVPFTLNYDQPDPFCPVNVVHERPLEGQPRTALLINHATMGHTAALVLAAAQ